MTAHYCPSVVYSVTYTIITGRGGAGHLSDGLAQHGADPPHGPCVGRGDSNQKIFPNSL